MRVRVALVLMALAPGGLGCVWHGHRMVPASFAHPVPGLSAAAAEGAAGVEVLVEADAWPEDVVRLDRGVTPIRVTVENHSGADVLVSHDELTLRGRGDRLYAALAPEEAAAAMGDRTATIAQPIFGPAGMAGGDGLRPIPAGPGAAASASPRETSFPYNAYYVRGYTVTPQVRRVQAVARALPEGVVPAGGTVSGFVYFARSVYRERHLMFEARLIKATPAPGDGAALARVRVPLRVLR